MPMKNPPHPGKGIRDDLEALGLSVAEGAKALGISRSQLVRVVGGKCAISPELALRLECVIGSTTEAWLNLQAAYDAAQVRGRAREITRGLKRAAPASDQPPLN